ncbi:Protein of unknown function (DUF2934) [Mariprofundus ferrinatatus]|uniref:DUF2934 domain-containing protein n=1 Tax=Mariprofundus ferrinatatus TaxID=1921087 RepID=A0A2K8L553_9PROT|nr:DUF2934 domain-containing protein [Mariprofundus ferrinatatus]ATX82448.1 Protein of unknown function (DUF2934) [Mariprofundus ferrinatatus]
MPIPSPFFLRNCSAALEKRSVEELHEMIEVAAYFLAEKRGFEGDHRLYDWLEAEKMICHIYGEGRCQSEM